MPDVGTLVPLAIAAAIGYLAGSIPFGLILTHLAGLGDIRRIGSGNIGATNVLRTGNKRLALATLLLDGGKGAGPTLACAAALGPGAGLAAGAAAVLGHNFPVWLGFRGGKGVATTLGVLLAIDWIAGLLALATWLAAARLSRVSAVGALAALALAPLYVWARAGGAAAVVVLGLAVLGIVRHHANIQRLIAGTEPRIGGDNRPSTARNDTA